MRRRVAVLAALLTLVGACTSSGSGTGPTATDGSTSSPPAGGQSSSDATSVPPPPGGATARALIEQTCRDNSQEVLLRTWRGIMPGRSGNLQIISRFPDYIGAGLTHSSPYDYTQEVPFFLYGPGYIKPGVYRRAGDARRPRADDGRAHRLPVRRAGRHGPDRRRCSPTARFRSSS